MAYDTASRRYTVAELFCGCGGFSRGFVRSGRFKVVLGNDIKKAALRTFAFNHSIAGEEPVTLPDDIRKIPATDVIRALERRGIGVGELDCLIGGPPCQGFSQLRRSEERQDNRIVRFSGYNRLAQDPRNDLVLRFLELAAELQPKVIVIENVPQLLRHAHNGVIGGLFENVKEVLGDMGYSVDVATLNAANYGVPQLRERVFILASRFGKASFPDPSHSDPEVRGLFDSRRPWVTVSDAIGDLPLAPGAVDDLGGGPLSLYRGDVEASEYATALRSSTTFPFNHVTRRYSPQIIRLIQQMQPGETWDHASARMQMHYQQLVERNQKPGEDPEATMSRLEQNGLLDRAFYRRYYWSAYTRLAWTRPALTITANANFLGSGRFTHPEADRGITMREAARLQSFDDDFRFITSPDGSVVTTNIGVGLDMIGEAVPPLLAQKIAQNIATLLDKRAHSGHASEAQGGTARTA